MGLLPPEALALAAGQHSRLSRADLLRLGCSSTRIDRWLAAGVLERVAPGHYRIPGAATGPLEVVATAVDRCGPGAWAGADWACGLHALEGFDLSGRRLVLLDPARRVSGTPFTVLRSPVEPVDRTVVAGIPTVRVERALIGIAATCGSRAVRVAFDDARRKGLTVLRRVEERAGALGRVQGAPQMRRLIRTGALAMESEGERCFDTIWRPGDPRPLRQVWVTPTIRVDFAWPEARLVVEYDGGRDHDGGAGAARDRRRDLELAALDVLVVRVDGGMIRRRADGERVRRRLLAVRQARLGRPPLVPASVGP